MKRNVFCFTLCALLQGLCPGAEFQNLGFDDAKIQLAYAGQPGQQSLNPTNGLPGWMFSWGSGWLDVSVNQSFGGEGDWVMLEDAFWLPLFTEGRFALSLYRARVDSPVFRLSQTGTVPAQTQYLTYRQLRDRLDVEINGEIIPPLNWPLPFLNWRTSIATNLIYDVARFAGQEVTLAFSGPIGQTNGVINGYLGAEAEIDGIQFVTAAAPLQFRRAGNQIIFSWPASVIGYTLQSSRGWFSPWPIASWRNLDIAPVVVGDQQTVTVKIGGTNLFYRLGLIQMGLPPPTYGGPGG